MTEVKTMNRNFLIVVDMQNDFIDGALGTKEAVAVVPNVLRRIQACRREGFAVIATLDTHPENYLQTREGQKLPVPHCIRGTGGWDLSPALKEALDTALKVEKPTFGSLKLPELVREISGGQPESIELVGLCTDICVVSNALLLKAAFPEARIQVRKDCCADVTPEKHAAALETMASCQIDIL